MPIREATSTDIEDLLEMGGRFLARTAYGERIAHNPAQLRKLAESLIEGENSVIFVSGDEDGRPDGMLGMLFFEHPMSSEPTASEVFWWGEGRSGVRLFRRAREWAKERGAVLFHMVAPSEKVADFYRSQDMGELETVFQERLT